METNHARGIGECIRACVHVCIERLGGCARATQIVAQVIIDASFGKAVASLDHLFSFVEYSSP